MIAGPGLIVREVQRKGVVARGGVPVHAADGASAAESPGHVVDELGAPVAEVPGHVHFVTFRIKRGEVERDVLVDPPVVHAVRRRAQVVREDALRWKVLASGGLWDSRRGTGATR